MRKITGFLYRNIVRPILFLFPADNLHEFFISVGKKLGKNKFMKKLFGKIWRHEDKILEQNICGLRFKNPVGLAAGFDYNADLAEILPDIGFGWDTIGTLTHEPYKGNSPPMLGRLPKSRSLLVNKGFKNKGVKGVLARMSEGERIMPAGISIGATNKIFTDFDAMVSDLTAGFRDAENFNNFDYYELNISCPNLVNLENLKEQLASPKGLQKALELLQKLNLKRPVFIKMPLEISEDEARELMEIADKFSFIKGLVFSNLAKNRANKTFDSGEIKNAGKGNFSGKPVEKQSNEILRFAYNNYGKRFVLVGVGGIFSAQDAYKKILLGASLVQLITGMIFMGPSQIGLINKELAKYLKKDGYRNIKEAVGALA